MMNGDENILTGIWSVLYNFIIPIRSQREESCFYVNLLKNGDS